MEVTIRAAEPGDEAALVPLYEWLFETPRGPVVPEAWDPRRAEVALRQAIESHDAVVLVAVAHDHAPGRTAEEAAGADAFVGVCTAYQDLHSVRFGYRAWIEDLAVAPGHRSQGIGSRLLAAARDWARERGATHLELDSADWRRDAHRFYEREGAAYRSISYGWPL